MRGGDGRIDGGAASLFAGARVQPCAAPVELACLRRFAEGGSVRRLDAGEVLPSARKRREPCTSRRACKEEMQAASFTAAATFLAPVAARSVGHLHQRVFLLHRSRQAQLLSSVVLYGRS